MKFERRYFAIFRRLLWSPFFSYTNPFLRLEFAWNWRKRAFRRDGRVSRVDGAAQKETAARREQASETCLLFVLWGIRHSCRGWVCVWCFAFFPLLWHSSRKLRNQSQIDNEIFHFDRKKTVARELEILTLELFGAFSWNFRLTLTHANCHKTTFFFLFHARLEFLLSFSLRISSSTDQISSFLSLALYTVARQFNAFYISLRTRLVSLKDDSFFLSFLFFFAFFLLGEEKSFSFFRFLLFFALEIWYLHWSFFFPQLSSLTFTG